MNPRQQLEELVTWTKQAGHLLHQYQPSVARVTDPIMARTSAHLGYLMTAHEFVEATQAPPIIKTALYTAAGVGMHKWNEIVVSEINRALNEYNQHNKDANTFHLLKSGLLIGATSLAISTGSSYFDSESSGTRFSGERVEYVQQNLTSEPINVLEEQILEPVREPSFSNQTETEFDFAQTETELSHLVQENLPKVHIADLEHLKEEIEQTFSRQQIVEAELHPRAQAHYDLISKGYNKKCTIEKFEKLSEYDDLLKTAADKYNIPYTTMFALSINESAGDKRAKSYAGARGLMQITPSTGKYIAKLMGKQFSELTGRRTFRTNDLYDPKINIEMGAFYLRFIHDRYGERIMKKRGEKTRSNGYKEWTETDMWDFTMACYNRGPSGMTRNMIKFGADTFWDLKKNQTTDEARRYVPKIRAIEKLYVEQLQENAGISNEVAKWVH